MGRRGDQVATRRDDDGARLGPVHVDEPTTAGVIQHFADTEHAGVMAEIVAAAADQALTSEQAEMQVVAAAERWREAEAQRALQSLLRRPLEQLTAEDRQALASGLAATARGPRSPS